MVDLCHADSSFSKSWRARPETAVRPDSFGFVFILKRDARMVEEK